ncbi:MAG: hypothetical protein Q9160_001391 [Pyrenula sp. 1 TL-2023]
MVLTIPSLFLIVVLIFNFHAIADIKIDSKDDMYDPHGDRDSEPYQFPARGSCDATQEQKIKDDLRIAKKMAAGIALNSGGTTSMGKLAQSVFDVLFVQDELDVVKKQLGAVSSIESRFKVVIFCNEIHQVMLNDATNRNTRWVDSTWKGKEEDGSEALVRIGREPSLEQDPDAPVPSPRKRICESEELIDAYTSIETGNDDLSGEAHIILCPSYFHGNSESARMDTRSIDEINAKGLKKAPGLNILTNIYPSARTILHELQHVVGGVLKDANGQPFFAYSAIVAPQYIHDTPSLPCYGFVACYKVKQEYVRETDPTKKAALTPSRNADSFVSLCMAVAIQPKVDSTGKQIHSDEGVCKWFSGEVDPDTLEPLPNYFQRNVGS